MPEKNLFEYAVIRVVPHVEREEFLNVGVILYCPKEKFLEARIELDEDRLKMFTSNIDCKELNNHLKAFETISKGGAGAGAIGKLDMPSRFRWLTATRSTVLQCSNVHPGLTSGAAETLDNLVKQLVLRRDE